MPYAIELQGETALGFVDVASDEPHRLVKTIQACRGDSGTAKLLHDILLCRALPATARFSPFELVIGQYLHVGPPGLTVEVNPGRSRTDTSRVHRTGSEHGTHQACSSKRNQRDGSPPHGC